MESSGKQPSIVTIFAIWNTMMGTSILSMPWAVMQAGLTLGVIILVLMGCLTLYSCYRIINSPSTIEGGCGLDFPDVCAHYFGGAGRVICLVFSMTALGGALIIYWVLMSNFLYNTGLFIHHKIHGLNVSSLDEMSNHSLPVLCRTYQKKQSLEIPPIIINSNITTEGVLVSPPEENPWGFETLWDARRSVPLILVPLVLPLLNFRSALFFARFNNLGTLSVLYLVVLVSVKASQWGGVHLKVSWLTDNHDGFVPEFNVSFPVMTGVLTLAYFIHNCAITLLKNNRHPHHNVRDLAVGYLLVGSTYLYVGTAVYSCFPSPMLPKQCIEQNFLDNLPSDDVLAAVARMFLLFQLTTVYPLLAYLVRVQLLTQLYGDPYPSVVHVVVLNVVLVTMGVLMARFYPNIGSIIRYSGALCGLVFVFVLPCLIHLLVSRRRGDGTVLSAAIHIIIMALGVANLVSQFLM